MTHITAAFTCENCGANLGFRTTYKGSSCLVQRCTSCPIPKPEFKWDVHAQNRHYIITLEEEMFVAYEDRTKENKPLKLEIKCKTMPGILRFLCGPLSQVNAELYIKGDLNHV